MYIEIDGVYYTHQQLAEIVRAAKTIGLMVIVPKDASTQKEGK